MFLACSIKGPNHQTWLQSDYIGKNIQMVKVKVINEVSLGPKTSSTAKKNVHFQFTERI